MLPLIHPRELRRIGIAAEEGDHPDGMLTRAEQALCNRHAMAQKIALGGDALTAAEDPAQIGMREAKRPAKLRDAPFGIAVSRLDILPCACNVKLRLRADRLFPRIPRLKQSNAREASRLARTPISSSSPPISRSRRSTSAQRRSQIKEKHPS